MNHPDAPVDWAKWLEDFKRRHGIAMPLPPEDAKTPPRPPTDPERDEEPDHA